ncbi:MAG: alanine racemase [Candidatus Doudnabacteria bacterium]|nr:alanine racemase [Candidatus Doudnabacteria bacterium]
MLNEIIGKIIAPRVKYDPLIRISIFSDSLTDNLRAYQRKYPGVQFAPVLKSNAYGHGLVEVAAILDRLSPPFFAVDSFFEALSLRRARIKSKILIMGYTREELMTKRTLKDVSFSVFNLERLKILASRLKYPGYFQLKVDTGMHRLGILASELGEALRLIKSNPNIILEGVYTHFADADNPDESFTKQQISTWNETAKIARKALDNLQFIHAAATAGIAYASEIEGNVCRLGIGLYGINVAPRAKVDLKPALEMKSVLTGFKKVEKGDYIGYSRLFCAPGDMIVATVPVGYNEGVDLRLSNKGVLLVRGQICPIIGRVSMNMTTIDISGLQNPKEGEEVVVFSNNPDDRNSVENVGKTCGIRNPRELLVRFPSYLRREVV